jgi:hypothetical protein
LAQPRPLSANAVFEQQQQQQQQHGSDCDQAFLEGPAKPTHCVASLCRVFSMGQGLAATKHLWNCQQSLLHNLVIKNQ